MPSDEHLAVARDALLAARAAFQTALAATAEQIRTFLDQQRAARANGRGTRLASELGSFAAGRIDAGRLAGVIHEGPACDPTALAAVERALATLAALQARDAAAEVVDLPHGGDLALAAGRALAEVGRAFAAVRTFELVRAGSRPEETGAGADGFPYARWSRGERRLAPPLIVYLDGADLRATALAEFLDGAQKIVLVVRGSCAPAPLARLVTPNVFVLQGADRAQLDRLVAWPGPAIAALVPEGAARFVHDPAAGAHSWDRLRLDFVPEREPRTSVGGLSGAQQAEDLRWLRQLATPPVMPAAPVAAAAAAPGSASAPPALAAAEPVDRLAAWLLARANLADLE